MYNLRPVGQATCSRSAPRSPATSRGAERLVERCRKRLGIGLEETTKDGKFTMVEVECIAGCDRAPVDDGQRQVLRADGREEARRLLDRLSRES